MTTEILQDLQQMVNENPDYKYRADLWKNAQKVEKEVLLRGQVPASAVRGETAMALTKVNKGLAIYGKIMTVYDMGNATAESIETSSLKPLGKETVRQMGSWGGAWIGAKAGAKLGFLVGVPGGPLAIITTAGGGIAGGVVGFFAGDYLADRLFGDGPANVKQANNMGIFAEMKPQKSIPTLLHD